MDGLTYSDNYKVSIAIEALREKETLVEIANRNNLEPFLIRKWKIEFIDLVETLLKMKNLEIEHLKKQLNYQNNNKYLMKNILYMEK